MEESHVDSLMHQLAGGLVDQGIDALRAEYRRTGRSTADEFSCRAGTWPSTNRQRCGRSTPVKTVPGSPSSPPSNGSSGRFPSTTPTTSTRDAFDTSTIELTRCRLVTASIRFCTGACFDYERELCFDLTTLIDRVYVAPTALQRDFQGPPRAIPALGLAPRPNTPADERVCTRRTR
jgi:hypothetical protein